MTLWHLPPGVDFARELVAGMDARLGHLPPQDWGSVTLFLNTRRMQRRVQQVLADGPPRILPRMRLITDLALDPLSTDLPLPVPPLQRRLELCRLVAPLLSGPDAPAPRSALFDLAGSLAALMDEMAGEGVAPDVLQTLDVSGHSAHWDRSLRFLNIVQDWQAASGGAPDREARQRAAILQLVDRWQTNPPPGPVIVAGSTGSRGATALFLTAVARLPQGAVVLPGFDPHLPRDVWDRMSDALTAEDHPQYRFRRLADMLAIHPADIAPWTAATPPDPARNRLVSLALRPAPVTDAWLAEGPALGPLGPATAALTLVEAPSPRAEAEVIALRLRAAVADGQRAALITPDRMLTRQVAAALDRWNILPDDSAGVPLALTPPGRLLRMVADLLAGRAGPTGWLSALKHPLAHSADRGKHLLQVQAFELWLRRNGPAMADKQSLQRADVDPIWSDWLAALMERDAPDGPLSAHVARHLALAEALAGGPMAEPAALWDKPAGRAARALMADLTAHADAGPAMTATEYAALFAALISAGEVREPDAAHPDILFWGTIEARVGGADLVILGGMNDGTWPESPPPDPWLNRALRLQAGLLLPERRIGLSAHDWQQAMAAGQVWITRATRDAAAQTVPSRWVNRLTNLLAGLKDTGGPEALAVMRNRGAGWLAAAASLSATGEPAPDPRPSPRTPVDHRPKRLSVTQIGPLVRDPYAIYASHILRLEPLDPLVPGADGLLRGSALHKVLERFIAEGGGDRDRLLAVADAVLADACPWPTVRAMWRASVARWADWFVAEEAGRQAIGTPEALEQMGEITLPEIDFTLRGKADRIDVTPDGRLLIYDYKSGEPPSVKQQLTFDKQLLIEAAMVEQGAFKDPGPVPVQGAVYIALGPEKTVAAPLAQQPPERVWEELLTLLRGWQAPERGYTARRAVAKQAFDSPYDHLSRFGEWDETTPATPIDVGRG